MKPSKKDLEEAIKDKLSPLLEETMEKHWGLTIPKLETDITDQLTSPQLNIYIPQHLTFSRAKHVFKSEFLKRELRLHRGNVSQLAKTLELDRRSIHRAIKDLDIDRQQGKGKFAQEFAQDDLHTFSSKEQYQREVVDQAIRGTLGQYKELIQPQQMEKFYQDVPSLSRNIVKFLPYQEWSWKEAEQEFEKQFLQQALKENQGKIGETAAKIGIRPETLHRKMKKLGVRKA